MKSYTFNGSIISSQTISDFADGKSVVDNSDEKLLMVASTISQYVTVFAPCRCNPIIHIQLHENNRQCEIGVMDN